MKERQTHTLIRWYSRRQELELDFVTSMSKGDVGSSVNCALECSALRTLALTQWPDIAPSHQRSLLLQTLVLCPDLCLHAQVVSYSFNKPALESYEYLSSIHNILGTFRPKTYYADAR